MKNWWHYHKWYVVCGILLCLVSLQLTGNALGWFKKSPDFQIAYVGEASLPEDTVESIKRVFSSFAGDYNRDGEILVQVNQYVSGSLEDTSADAAGYCQAAELRLTADINDCESYFFLLENPETFQKQYQVLAKPDGSCPDDADISTNDKAFLWSSLKSLSEADLGSYTVTLLGQETTGSNQDILSSLYLSRRCFYDAKETEHAEECAVLWDTLKGVSSDSRQRPGDQVRIGRYITIDAPEPLTLLENKDALAADGLYYATWTDGNSVPYENSEGKMVDLYDAQLYFLVSETPDEETAVKNCNAWLAAARENYEVCSEEMITCNGQTYTLISYNCTGSSTPYDHGISVFGTCGANAVCAEFTCLKNYSKDLKPILTGFLNGCSFSAD